MSANHRSANPDENVQNNKATLKTTTRFREPVPLGHRRVKPSRPKGLALGTVGVLVRGIARF